MRFYLVRKTLTQRPRHAFEVLPVRTHESLELGLARPGAVADMHRNMHASFELRFGVRNVAFHTAIGVVRCRRLRAREPPFPCPRQHTQVEDRPASAGQRIQSDQGQCLISELVTAIPSTEQWLLLLWRALPCWTDEAARVAPQVLPHLLDAHKRPVLRVGTKQTGRLTEIKQEVGGWSSRAR